MKVKQLSIETLAQSPAWFGGFLAAVGTSTVVIVLNVLLSELRPGNVWGLSYGIAGTVLLVGTAAYSIRRRAAKYAPGRSRDWLQFHVYAGTLFLLILLMHTGFHLPSGILAWAMWLTSIWLVLSGWIGVAFQKWIPRLLTSGLRTEVLYDRIPELVTVIRKQAEALVATCDEPLRNFHYDHIANSLTGPQHRMIYFIDITGGIQARLKQFDYLRRISSGEDERKVGELESLYRTKLEIDAHYTLQKTLRWWLYGHVPVSIILMILVGFHIFSILKY